MKVIDITNLSEFLKAITNFTDNDSEALFYRGQSAKGKIKNGKEETWELKSSLSRNQGLIKNEHKIFREIIARCPNDFEGLTYTFDKLVKMQHYELPTRLLDITSNPFVALWFACKKLAKDEYEIPGACVYVFGIKKQDIKYYDSDSVSVTSNLSRIPKDGWDIQSYFRPHAKRNQIDDVLIADDFSMQKLLHEIKQEKPQFRTHIEYKDLIDVKCVIPKANNPRIQAQAGAFFIFGLDEKEPNNKLASFPTNDYIKGIIKIDENSKKAILEELKAMRIFESTLFPELPNVAKAIKEEYDETKRTMQETKDDAVSILTNKKFDTQETKDKDRYKQFIYFDKFIPSDKVKNKFNFPSDVNIDKEEFIKLLSNSFALSLKEKKRVLDELANLEQWQINGLIDVWYEENIKFQELWSEHPEDIAKLIYKVTQEWYELIFDTNENKEKFTVYFKNHIREYECINFEKIMKIYFENIIKDTDDFSSNDILDVSKYLIDDVNIEFEWIFRNILYAQNRDTEITDFLERYQQHNIDKKYYRSIGISNCRVNKYDKALEYFEKIKNDECVLEYVEVALLTTENNIQNAKEYLKNKKSDCYDSEQDYEVLIKLFSLIIDLIEQQYDDIEKKVKSIAEKIDRTNKFELSWDWVEVNKIIERYNLSETIQKYNIQTKIIDEISKKQK